jgi:phospholipase A-2-activating protein
MSASPAYALRAECRGHEDDVRGVAVVAPDAFATCSRDKTVRVWREAIGDDGYATAAVCVGHTSFVTALARVPADATPSLPSGGLVSGSRDKSVIVWNDATNEPVAKLAGHSLDVTAVCVMRDGTIVSGAMDKSIRMWDASSGKCVRTIADAHGSSVLALLALPDSDGFLSGSADKTIKRWDIGHTTDSGGNASSSLTPSKTITGHADTVRGLALMPNVGFLSASHDCTARLWTLEGETVCVFIGHAALVYSASCVSVSSQTGSLVITGSEDNTAKLWNPNDGSCLQTIKHPGCVWAVSAFPSGGDGENGGDLVTCCADGVARVWTRDEKRKNHGAQRALDDALVAVAEAKAQASIEEQKKKIKTEPPESLHAPGEADGQTKVIAETGGSIAAYAWSAGTQSWERLGEVTGVDDTLNGKKTLDGVSYDFVFDVDIQEGAPVLKLPFNVGDNPYDAAERFLETNGLDPGYREQVVNFIVQNVGEDAFAGAGANVSADPFTGAGAYVPGTGVTTGAGAHRSADPFTGAGAYVPSANAPKAGGSSNATFKYVPAKPHQCVVFPTATSSFDKMLAKTKELGATEEELQAFARAASVADGSDTAAAMDLNSTRVLEKALNDWPVESLFPLLDLCKALSLRFDEKRLQSELSGSTATAMMAACARASRPPATAPNLLTAARLFANAFKCETTRRVFLLNASQILDGLAAATTADAKPALRLALATALLNFAAHFEPNKSDDEAIAAREVAPQAAAVGAELLMNATDLAANDGAESDASAVVFRALVALGTLAAKSAETKSLLRDLGVRELADSLARSRPEGKTNVTSAAEDVKKALAE